MSALTREPATRPPVLLPHVRVEVASDDTLSVTVDREPYAVPPDLLQLGRDAVTRILDDITARLATPVRVEVIDGGSTFTDIVTAASPTAPGTSPAPAAHSPSACDVAGSGFEPDESVAIAVVVAHQSAGADGIARLRLPPSLLANRSGFVVLLGKTSGTVALSGGTR